MAFSLLICSSVFIFNPMGPVPHSHYTYASCHPEVRPSAAIQHPSNRIYNVRCLAQHRSRCNWSKCHWQLWTHLCHWQTMATDWVHSMKFDIPIHNIFKNLWPAFLSANSEIKCLSHQHFISLHKWVIVCHRLWTLRQVLHTHTFNCLFSRTTCKPAPER